MLRNAKSGQRQERKILSRLFSSNEDVKDDTDGEITNHGNVSSLPFPIVVFFVEEKKNVAWNFVDIEANKVRVRSFTTGFTNIIKKSCLINS